MSTPLRHPKLEQNVELLLMPVLTRHAEAMQHADGELLSEKQVGMQLNANHVRAAIRCGLLVGAEEGAVDGWSPAFTLWVSGKVTAAISEALEVPPE